MKKILFFVLLFVLKQVNAQLCFGPATNFATGGQPNSVISVDFNGDTKLDLATANIGSGNVAKWTT